MSLSSESIGQLQAYGQLAIGFAGFAGVIGAFSRFRMHSEATAFRVRSMVALAVAEAVLTLLPPLTASFGATDTIAWRISAGIAAVTGTVLVIILGRGARSLYLLGHLKRNAAIILCAGAAIIILPLYPAALAVDGLSAEPFVLALLFFGILVCAYHFIMLMAAVRLDDRE